MTDDELQSLYRAVTDFLGDERNPLANVEPVSPQEAQYARRMLAIGRSGRCNVCGETKLHLHAEPDE